jgi:alpha-amylase
MNYETFGNLQPKESGIFEFLKALPKFAFKKGIEFSTPSEVSSLVKATGPISVPNPTSWTDEERDLSAWLGNDLQQEAFNKLYSVAERVRMSKDRRLQLDWNYLQSSDHFYYMSTKSFSDGGLYRYFSPYESPFEAFINYMNVLSDFMERVNAQFPSSVGNEELNSLLTTIQNQELKIADLEKQLKKYKKESPTGNRQVAVKKGGAVKKGNKAK